MSGSDRLKEISERAAKATPGPWREWVGSVYPPDSAAIPENDLEGASFLWPLPNGNEDDARFIAHAREDVPFLISKLETERAETIEVLENYEFRPYWERHLWWHEKAKPLLDKLKGGAE